MRRERESVSLLPPFEALIILVENQQIVKTITQLIGHSKLGLTNCQIIFQEVSYVTFLGRFIVKMPASGKKRSFQRETNRKRSV
jgi:hypothetical protein